MMSAGAVTAALVVLGGWFGGVDGNGRVKQEDRSVPAFSGVELSGGMDAEIVVGPAQKVTIVTDENLLPLLEVRVKDGVLNVDHPGSLHPTHGVRVVIAVPKLDRISASGGVTAQLAVSEKILGDASGGVEVRVKGHPAMELDTSGAATVRTE